MGVITVSHTLNDKILLHLYENNFSGEWINLNDKFGDNEIVSEKANELRNEGLIKLEPVFHQPSFIKVATGEIISGFQTPTPLNAKITFKGEEYVKKNLLQKSSEDFERLSFLQRIRNKIAAKIPEIIISIIVALLVAFLVYRFGWS